MKKYGITLYINPDGHEWLRAKWSAPVKKYWKISEKLMVKQADLVICDSKNIQKYILENYGKYNPKTTFIAYGADLNKSKLSDNAEELVNWYKEKNVQPHNYYLIVGRFVPENNYKTMIQEFMKSKTNKDLVIITNVAQNKFYEQLRTETGFEKDSRIKFVGTVYEKELIKKIRENAYGYLHGHSVGGTNPSLIEALATTDLNLLYDVGFNKEVAEDGAVYWNLDNMNLANLIDNCDKMESSKIAELSKMAKDRIKKEYTWEKIINDYEECFNNRWFSMENISLLHQVDMSIVKEVIQICDKYNLKYYMLGGTMLGAIRHKGFIPWDDDIDLGMPRKDYEKFLEVAQSELSNKLKLVNYKTDPKYQYYITRILDTETKVEEERIGNDSKYTNVSIDLFPIDGTPNNAILRKIYFFRILYHRALMSLCYKDSIDRKRKRSTKEKIFLSIMEKLPIEKITTPYKQKEKIDKLLKKQDVEKSKYIGNIMGAYRTREIVPKEYYGEGKFYKFEDIELRGMDMYDEYLTYTYGDYMKLPPEDKRKTHFRIIEIHGKNVEI